METIMCIQLIPFESFDIISCVVVPWQLRHSCLSRGISRASFSFSPSSFFLSPTSRCVQYMGVGKSVTVFGGKEINEAYEFVSCRRSTAMIMIRIQPHRTGNNVPLLFDSMDLSERLSRLSSSVSRLLGTSPRTESDKWNLDNAGERPFLFDYQVVLCLLLSQPLQVDSPTSNRTEDGWGGGKQN